MPTPIKNGKLIHGGGGWGIMPGTGPKPEYDTMPGPDKVNRKTGFGGSVDKGSEGDKIRDRGNIGGKGKYVPGPFFMRDHSLMENLRDPYVMWPAHEGPVMPGGSGLWPTGSSIDRIPKPEYGPSDVGGVGHGDVDTSWPVFWPTGGNDVIKGDTAILGGGGLWDIPTPIKRLDDPLLGGDVSTDKIFGPFFMRDHSLMKGVLC